MDYSQFLLMHHEIGLLIVFILVFLFDTFGCKKVQGSLSVTALVLSAPSQSMASSPRSRQARHLPGCMQRRLL